MIRFYDGKSPSYPYSQTIPLYDWDIKKLDDEMLEWAAYWYSDGDFEHKGWILFRKNSMWYTQKLSHYINSSPMERGLVYENGYRTINKMEKEESPYINMQLDALYKLAREEGYH